MKPITRQMWWCTLIIVVILGGLQQLVTATQSRAAEQVRCAEYPLVVIESAEFSQHELICRFAGRAIDFLGGYGLRIEKQITIEIVQEAIDNHGYIAYGSYDSRSDRISLMSLDAIRASSANAEMYDEPFDEEHYGGAVAHEVAHAVVQPHLTEKPLSPAPQEYLAHATQLAVLSREKREAIISRSGVGPWLPGDTISDIYMALQPTGFAVKSYLHLMSLSDPASFVTLLLGAKWFYVYVPD